MSSYGRISLPEPGNQIPAVAFNRQTTCASFPWGGEIMPGDPKECRERAAHCLELAASSANEGIKKMFLNIAKHWQMLAEELEHTKSILDDEKGAVKFSRKKPRKKMRSQRSR